MDFIPHREHCNFITKTSMWIEFREVVGMWAGSRIKYRVFEKWRSLYNVTARDTCDYHWV